MILIHPKTDPLGENLLRAFVGRAPRMRGPTVVHFKGFRVHIAEEQSIPGLCSNVDTSVLEVSVAAIGCSFAAQRLEAGGESKLGFAGHKPIFAERTNT